MKKKELKEILNVYKKNMIFTNSRVREMITQLNKLDATGIYEENTIGIKDKYYQDFAEIIYGYFGQITRIRQLKNSVKENREQRDMVQEYAAEFALQLSILKNCLAERYSFCKDNVKELEMLNKELEQLAVAVYILENLV